MTTTREPPRPKRRSVNLTISADVLAAAKALELNASQAAERGIMEAVKAARERQWLRDNREAIAAYNRRIEGAGPLLKPDWVDR